MADFWPKIGFWGLKTAKRGRNYERREKWRDFAIEAERKQREMVEQPGSVVGRGDDPAGSKK